LQGATTAASALSVHASVKYKAVGRPLDRGMGLGIDITVVRSIIVMQGVAA